MPPNCSHMASTDTSVCGGEGVWPHYYCPVVTLRPPLDTTSVGTRRCDLLQPDGMVLAVYLALAGVDGYRDTVFPVVIGESRNFIV